MPQAHSEQKALLIIDMQQGMFHGPAKPHHGERILANINTLIQQAHAAATPVFVVRHNGPKGSPIEPGSPMTQLLETLAINLDRDRVFDKHRPNCFQGTELAQWLKDAHVSELVIVGMKTEYCIDTTCRAAADLGFNPVLIADGHTTMDSSMLTAQQIIDHHNLTLSGPFVKLIKTAEYQF